MADAPNMPPSGGPPNNDPGMNQVFEKMNQTLSNVEGYLAKIAVQQGAIEDSAENATKHMRDFFSVSQKVEDVHKQIVGWAQKRGKLDEKDMRDASKMRKELKDLAGLYKTALETQKENNKTTRAWQTNLERINKVMHEIEHKGSLVEEDWKQIAEVFDHAAMNMKAIDKAIENIGRKGAAAKGIMGMLGAVGIGKGLTQRIDKRLQQQQELKEKIEESREMRRIALNKHNSTKRDKFFGEMQAAGVDMNTDTARSALAVKMGFKGQAAADFISGEKEIAGGGVAGKAYGAVMGSAGGGAMEALAGGMEDLLGGLTAIAPEIIIPLEALIGVITLLIEVFDNYAKQNADIERKVGAAGLFTQPGVGAFTAFNRARNALNPNVMATGANVQFGITQERNLALAGALAGGGYNLADSFGPGAANTANLAPGGRGQFMKGSLGEFQRIVMGVSRVSGLTDEEGAANLIKLLQEYRETMASSEDFMNTLNKDTQAAGISTTKYLKIIDDVSSHFDRMNKSLDQVTGTMRELSRYGNVSSESLKDMMEFLASGQEKTTLGNLSQSIFSEMVGGKGLTETERRGQTQTAMNLMQEVNRALARPGAEAAGGGLGADVAQAIKSGNVQDAMALVNAKRQLAADIKDRVTRQQVTDALAKLTDQLEQVATSQGGAFGRGAGKALYGSNLLANTTKEFRNINEVFSRAGGTISDYLEHRLSPQQMTQVMQEAQMLGLDLPKSMNTLRQEAQNRIEDVRTRTDPNERKKGYKELLLELDRMFKTKGGYVTALKRAGLDKLTKNADGTLRSMDDVADSLKDHPEMSGQLTDEIAGTGETQKKLLNAMSEDARTGDLAQKDALDQAAEIGSNTQTIEDILKNIFKPMLNDLVNGVAFIAEAVGKLVGKDFGLNQKQVKEDVSEIPDALKALREKADNNEKLMKEHPEQRDALFKQNQEILKEMQFMNDVATKGTVSSAAEQKALEKALGDTSKFTSGKSGNLTAVNAQDFTPGFWSKAMKGFSYTPLGAAIGGITSAMQQSGDVNHYYSSQINQDTANPGDSPSGGNEGPKPQTPLNGQYSPF